MRPGAAIPLCVLALLTLGVVMVTSARSTVSAPDQEHEPSVRSVLTGSSARHAGVALAAMGLGIAAGRFGIGRLVPAGLRPPGGADADRRLGSGHAVLNIAVLNIAVLVVGAAVLGGLLALVYLPSVARDAKGASRWLDVGIEPLAVSSLQPSELVKWASVALFAWFGARAAGTGIGLGRTQVRSVALGTGPAIGVMLVLAAAIALEDLGTAVLVAVSSGLLLIASGAGLRQFVLVGVVGALLAGVAIWYEPYRIDRIVAFIDPWADPSDTGYQILQGSAAISGGGLAGHGLGHGIQKLGFLPEDHTDFIFAVICEELGLPGAMLVGALYVALFCTLLGCLSSQTDRAWRLFTLGVMATIGVQAAINLLVVVGLAPTKGIALPLISHGGTGWVLGALCLGLVAGAELRHGSAEEARPG